MLNRAQKLALAALCCHLSPAAYAGGSIDIYNILMSTAANYQTGQKLKAATVVELKKGEKLRLKAQSSQEKCTLNGPYKGTVQCPDFVGNLNRLVPQTRNQVETQTDLWALDVHNSGNFCYDKDHNLTLWRMDAAQTEVLVLRDRDERTEVKLQWNKGSHYLSWPREYVSIRDNGRYQFKREGNTNYTTLRMLPSYLTRPGAKSVWMAQQGCTNQVDMLFTAERPSSLFD